MLIIKDKERYEKAKEFARKLGLVKQFAQQLNFLRTYANHKLGKPQCRVFLLHDFAPHSFSIIWEKWNEVEQKWKYWFNGGLIFHGSHDNYGDGGMPTLAVCLTPTKGWSVHT